MKRIIVAAFILVVGSGLTIITRSVSTNYIVYSIMACLAGGCFATYAAFHNHFRERENKDFLER